MPKERRPVPGRVAVGAVDIVGTGMSIGTSLLKSIEFKLSFQMDNNFLVGRVFESGHIDGAFQFWRQLGIEEAIDHGLGVLAKRFFSSLIYFLKEVWQFHGVWVKHQSVLFVFGCCLGLRFNVFPAKYCQDVLQSLPVCRVNVAKGL